jgi:hypothetical protein
MKKLMIPLAFLALVLIVGLRLAPGIFWFTLFREGVREISNRYSVDPYILGRLREIWWLPLVWVVWALIFGRSWRRRIAVGVSVLGAGIGMQAARIATFVATQPRCVRLPDLSIMRLRSTATSCPVGWVELNAQVQDHLNKLRSLRPLRSCQAEFLADTCGGVPIFDNFGSNVFTDGEGRLYLGGPGNSPHGRAVREITQEEWEKLGAEFKRQRDRAAARQRQQAQREQAERQKGLEVVGHYHGHKHFETIGGIRFELDSADVLADRVLVPLSLTAVPTEQDPPETSSRTFSFSLLAENGTDVGCSPMNPDSVGIDRYGKLMAPRPGEIGSVLLNCPRPKILGHIVLCVNMRPLFRLSHYGWKFMPF